MSVCIVKFNLWEQILNAFDKYVIGGILLLEFCIL
jgi:hypothetical protein